MKVYDEYYTENKLAEIIKAIAIVIAIIGAIAGFIFGINQGEILIAIIYSILAVICVIPIYALGEIIEIMQDIRTNTEQIRDYIEKIKTK